MKASRPLFEGVIKLKEQRDLMLNITEITYTITKGKIRREAVPIAPLGKLADLGTAKAGVICDVLIIPDGNTAYEVRHCQTLSFDRPLLELVELALPVEVTVFPCQLRRLKTVSSPPVDPAQSKAWQLLKQGASFAAKAAEAAMKYEIDLVTVTEGSPPDTSFVLDSSFSELGSWEEFSLRFDPPNQHHHGDWD